MEGLRRARGLVLRQFLRFRGRNLTISSNVVRNFNRVPTFPPSDVRILISNNETYGQLVRQEALPELGIPDRRQ